mgnify:CR=1 FL=1
MKKDLLIIGGGPAGMAAAVAAYDKGITDILILERDRELGGILNQCIHNGFGLHTFSEELTGPEYAARYEEMVYERRIPYLLDTMVVDVQGGDPCRVTAMNSTQGLFTLEAKAVVLAMGCRERPRGAMNIPGYRPSGIYSAGTAQRFVNREGRLPGREVVILGSGDIGLIMARRMHLQGARVKLVAEIMPYSGGLRRNIVQCLDDFGIPLKLSHTVTEIHGKERVTGVTVSKVDENLKPIPGSEEYVSCDTVLLSCGLIPENELSEGAGAEMDPVTKGPVVNASLMTTAEGIFACGNVLHVHDLVDFVTAESARAGQAAAALCAGTTPSSSQIMELKNGPVVSYTVPQRIHMAADFQTVDVFFRVRAVCGKSRITVTDEAGTCLASFRRERLAPGEMENIKLPRKLLENAQGSITVSVEEDPA